MRCKAKTLAKTQCQHDANGKDNLCGIHRKKLHKKGGENYLSRHICKSCPKAAHKLKKTWQIYQSRDNIIQHYKKRTQRQANKIKQINDRTNLSEIRDQLANARVNLERSENCKKNTEKCLNIVRQTAQLNRLSAIKSRNLQKKNKKSTGGWFNFF